MLPLPIRGMAGTYALKSTSSRVEKKPWQGDRRSVEGRLNLAGHLRLARRSEEGQTMAEYAVVVGMITIAIVAVFTSLGDGGDRVPHAVTGSI